MDKAVNIMKVAVLMPVYNAEKYLKEAIESILNQTYKGFDFFIINDGSTDSSEEIILSYTDKRIIYIKNEGNKGLIYTLNKGLELIQGDYLLRMDADDIAMPQRIEKQILFMEQHPGIILSGTQAHYFGRLDKKSKFPTDHERIKVQLLFNNCIVHPSIIMRLKKIKQNKLMFDSNYVHIEDYEFWIRALKYGELAILDEVLLNYRLDGQNITQKNWQTRDHRLKKIFTGLLNEIGIEPTEQNLQLHLELSGNKEFVNDISTIKKYSLELISKNKKEKIYDIELLKEIIDEYLKKLFFKIAEKGFFEVLKFWFYTRTISIIQVRYFVGSLKKGRSIKIFF